MLQLDWHGPFTLDSRENCECVFDQRLASKPGMYFWTIKYRGAYLINYVGETKRTLCKRLMEHVKWLRDGRAGFVLAPDLFITGKWVAVARPKLTEFRVNRAVYLPKIDRVLAAYRLFLARLETEDQVRKIVEGSIIRALRAAGGAMSSFLVNDNRLHPSAEVSFNVSMVSPVRFHGLGKVIKC